MKNKGFTLLEVMIALTIFALIATTLSQAASITVDNQIHIERKLLATWIAENQIIEMRSIAFEEVKNKKVDLKYGDREWLITVTAKPQKKFGAIPIPLEVKKVEVSVALKPDTESPLQTLVAYIAND